MQTDQISINDVQEFYGPSAARIKHMQQAVSAMKQFRMAANAQSPGIADRALALACKNEELAFAA